MSKMDMSPAFLDPKLAAHAAGAMTFQQERASRNKKRLWLSLSANVILVVVDLGLTFTLAAMMPTVRVQPVFWWARPDGSVEASVTTASLPGNLTDAQLRYGLWKYVRERESYSWIEAPYEYDVVSGMSAPHVRDAYQLEVSGKNPQSPMKRYGKTGSVRVDYVSSSIKDGTATFHYTRIVEAEGEKMVSSSWVTVFEFSTNLSVPARDRIQYNPIGIAVTNYPGAEQESVPQ